VPSNKQFLKTRILVICAVCVYVCVFFVDQVKKACCMETRCIAGQGKIHWREFNVTPPVS